ncbi:MAG: cytochrome c [Bauldia sp.]
MMSRVSATLAALIAGAAFLAPAMGQEPPPDARTIAQGATIWKEKIGCNNCHGWSGNGVPDDSRMPVGANLRDTKLNREQLVEVIKCGRPGTGMPHFDARAYTDPRCYGVTAEQLGNKVPPEWGASLIPREIDALVAYMETRVIGRGPLTKAECEEYFGAGAQVCTTFTFGTGGAAPVPSPAARPGADPHG